METLRDIVIVVFGITGTITLLVTLVVLGLLYSKLSRALDEVARPARDVHKAVDAARTGAKKAGEVLAVVSAAVPTTRRLKVASLLRRRGRG